MTQCNACSLMRAGSRLHYRQFQQRLRNGLFFAPSTHYLYSFVSALSFTPWECAIVNLSLSVFCTWFWGLLLFLVQRFGSDSKAYMPSAYVRGSVDTFKAEASDITSRSATHGVMAHKDLKTESLMSLPAKQNHLSKLAMMGDIATLNDIHSAYIHGSIPTAKGESDDIMDLNFPDEVRVLHVAFLCWSRCLLFWVDVCVLRGFAHVTHGQITSALVRPPFPALRMYAGTFACPRVGSTRMS